MKTSFTEENILAAARRFLGRVFGDEGLIPEQSFYGQTLGIGIAQELGVKLSTEAISVDNFIGGGPEEIMRSLQTSDLFYERVDILATKSSLNCGQVAFGPGVEVSCTEDFKDFLKTGTIRFSRFTKFFLREDLDTLKEIEDCGLFIDRIQKDALVLLSPMFKSTSKGVVITLDNGSLRVIPPRLWDETHSAGEIIFTLMKLLCASKTQKRNLKVFCSRRRIITRRMFGVCAYILSSKQEISKTILRSLRKLLLDPARSAILLKSARMAERRMSFDHWVEVIRFARRHANREVFTLLDRVFSSLEEFKAIVEDHFYSGFHTWEQVFPEINREGFVIRQITNSRDLEREGEEQHNCCRMYVKKMEDYIILSVKVISVKAERRYTVSFRRTNGKTYQLDQFKAKFNEQPLKEDYWKVLQIIEECSSIIPVNLVLPAPGTQMVW